MRTALPSSRPAATVAAPVSRATSTGFRAEVVTSPAAFTTGKPVKLEISVTGANGKKVSAFDDLHTKPMHLIAVSADLKDFSHLHPVPGRGGALSVNATFNRKTSYDVVMEYDPKGAAGQQTSRVNLAPRGAAAAKADLTAEVRAAAGARFARQAGGLRAQINGGEVALRAGRNEKLTFALTDARTGKPVTNLQNLMGMPGHAIVFSEDRKFFAHLHGETSAGHPMDGMDPAMPGMNHSSGAMGGMSHGSMSPRASTGASATEVTFEAKFPKPGKYKIWGQFQREGKVVTVDYAVEVR